MSQDGALGSVLVLDTCGERGTVALFRAGVLQAERTLAERTASASLLHVIQDVLQGSALKLDQLAGIGVVNGPGSFTGLRIGLALAKGLCESGKLPVAPVSRLAVLADAAHLHRGYAVLRAGKDELYIRAVRLAGTAEEQLITAAALQERAHAEDELAYAEDGALPLLPTGPARRRVEVTASAAYPLVQAVLLKGGEDLASLDGNYVRNEQAIYVKPAERTS